MKTYHALSAVFFLYGSVSVSAGIDDTGIKERLVDYCYADEGIPLEKIDDIKKNLAVTDEQFHRVLMEVYREAESKRSALTPKTEEWSYNQKIMACVIGWLPKCGNIPVKDFLLDCAVSKEKDSFIRNGAVLSYLRVADAEEAKEILLRFLVGENRADLERLSVYGFARMAYDESDSPEKKAAILAALAVAADKEEGKIRFMKVDGILAERSAAYRQSHERLAMLKRHSQEPPTANLYTDRDLRAALEESRKNKRHTGINTNLAALAEQNFNLPQTNFGANGVSALVPISPDSELEPPAPPPSRPPRPAVLLAVGAGLLAAFFLWRGLRKKKS